ncbi:MAG: hypothetical protein NXY57DRAFT_1043560 [Lentinula lateritia]|nr:MAG: hypothetical protein NXY57DRAFT_1043560 [Lentinula lateritia]
MNHTKLNQLAKQEYSPTSGGSDDDDYEPSQQTLSPTKRHHYDQLLTQRNPSLLPPRSSALAGRSANEDLVNSGVFDDGVGSQDFLECLCASRGLDSSILYSEDFKDGASDIENAEFMAGITKTGTLWLNSLDQINVDEHGIELISTTHQSCEYHPVSLIIVHTLLLGMTQMHSNTPTTPVSNQSIAFSGSHMHVPPVIDRQLFTPPPPGMSFSSPLPGTGSLHRANIHQSYSASRPPPLGLRNILLPDTLDEMSKELAFKNPSQITVQQYIRFAVHTTRFYFD